MGSGSLFPDPEQDETRAQTSFVPPFPRSQETDEFWRREPKRRYIILFLLTFITTTFAGIGVSALDVAFQPIAAYRALASGELIALGLWYSIPVLIILGAHEFGHYLACVYYRVNASLPYFLPLPFPPSGTLGAVIRIRQPIPGKRALFDIGIAGPLAGFVALIPVLFLGVMMSDVGPLGRGSGFEFGEPLLFKLAAWFVFGAIPEGSTVYLHPLGFAAWWGMLATALNLFPVGQLDGGHITYAVLGRTSTRVTIGALICLIALTVFASTSWLVWTILIVAMMAVTGPHHPRVADEDVPLNRERVVLAAVAAVVFVVCFTPNPIEIRDLVDARPEGAEGTVVANLLRVLPDLRALF
jgi:membrane-associated protease RseP (regulator of RpoE activity)